MFLEFVLFQILSLCIFCIFGQGFSDVQIDVYKVSKERKLNKLSNTFCLRGQKLNVHITVKYLTECYLTATNCDDIDGTQSLPGWHLLQRHL